MVKKIISKLRVINQGYILRNLAKKGISYDLNNDLYISHDIEKNKSLEVFLHDISPGKYELILSSESKDIHNIGELSASFDIAEVLKIENKQKYLGLDKYSSEYGIYEEFKSFQLLNKEFFYVKITLNFSRKIETLRVIVRSKNKLYNLKKLYFVNVKAPQYAVCFVNKLHELAEGLKWHRFNTLPNKFYNILTSAQYKGINRASKKALLLLRLYNTDGKEIKENEIINLSYSSVYDCYFRYIPNTDLKEQIITELLVPKNISYIEISQVPFNLQDNEEVLFGEIKINESKKNISAVLELNKIRLFSQQDVLKTICKVEPGKFIQVYGDIRYENLLVSNKKALLLVKFLDKHMNVLDEVPKNLLWIEKFSSYYKYLPDTEKKEEMVYDCQLSSNVHFIEIGLIGFSLKDNESVFLNLFSLKYQHIMLNDNVKRHIVTSTAIVKYIPPSLQEKEMSVDGWIESIDINKPTLMGIMDEFTQGCFAKEVNLIQPRVDNWPALLEKYSPDLIFIESAWKGNFGNWQYRISKYSNKPGNEIEQLCIYSKEKSVPTIFWNKEDPVHHERFMESAKLAEYIFTTDQNMIESYQKRTGNNKVYTLPFAAQPSLHKPQALICRKNKSCFAGSWYGNRHEERGQVIVWLLDAAQRYGLDIFDRNYTLGHSPFPSQYQANIVGSLPYLELCEEYRNYRVFLNVNSVINSPTMFSRRVFELMASGTPIVSTYSQGIEEFFTSKAVWLVKNQKEAEEAIKILMTDDKEWRRRSLAGIREVFQYHTYAHRLNYIFEKIGVTQKVNVKPKTLILILIKNQVDIVFAREFKRNQKYDNYEIVLIYNDKFIPNYIDDLMCVHIKNIDTFINEEIFTFYGTISSDYQYGDYYLIDLINASAYEPNANAYAICSSIMKNITPYEYLKYNSLLGVIFKDKEFFIKRFINSSRTLEDYDVFMVDSDEFIEKNEAR